MSDKYPIKDSITDAAVDDSLSSSEGADQHPQDSRRTTLKSLRGREGEPPAPIPDTAREKDAHTDVKTSAVELTDYAVRNRKLIIIAAVSLLALLAFLMWSRSQSAKKQGQAGATQGEKKEALANEVMLTSEAIASAGLEIVSVTERPAIALMRVTGTVEANQQQMQEVTPLVSGRVERVLVALGDRVRAGAVLAIVASPEVAQLHAKLHETEMHLALAQRNLARVERSENRVAVLQAKARLDEAEATLNRTRRLIELGAGAGKDLIAAETAYKTAKAEYDFQSNISLNREVQEARAEVETTRADVSHVKDQLRALGASTGEDEGEKGGEHHGDTSLIALRAPVSGTVSERKINPGAGIEAGKPVLMIANLSNLWVVANVPEAQVIHLRIGTPAEVRSAALGSSALAGRVTYIDLIVLADIWQVKKAGGG